MSKEAMTQHGAFSWNELMTTDVTAAKNFYGELLGWTLQDMDMGGMTYTVIKAGDCEVGGIMTMSEGAKKMPPMWGAYITVDDVDALTSRVEQLGGIVSVPPQDIPDVGRFCVIQDPQGASVALITYVKKP